MEIPAAHFGVAHRKVSVVAQLIILMKQERIMIILSYGIHMTVNNFVNNSMTAEQTNIWYFQNISAQL